MPYKQINQDRGFRAVSVLALGLKILINRASVDPGRELNARAQQSHLFGDVDVAGPVGPPSPPFPVCDFSRPFPRGLRAFRPVRRRTRDRQPWLAISAVLSGAPLCAHY